MKTHSLIIVLSLLSFNVMAQFKNIDPFPSFDVGNLSELFITSPNEIFIHVLGRYDSKIKSTILQTEDSTLNWKYVNIFPVDGKNGYVYQINKDTFIIYSDSIFITYDKFKSFHLVDKYPLTNNGYQLIPRYTYVHQNILLGAFEEKITNTDTVGLYKSNDFGKTWTQVSNTTIKEIGFADKNTGYGIGYGETVEYNRIFKTTDGGNSWFDLHNLNDTGGSYNFQFQEHFYKIRDANLWRSDDEGKTWVLLGNKLPYFNLSQSAHFLLADIGLIYGSGFGLYRTTDAGETWTQISDFSYPMVYNINTLQQNGKVYITVSEYNSSKTKIIYGVFDSTTIFTNSIDEPSKQTQYKVYPNPTKDKITISYNGFVSSETIIRLYDIQGRMIKEQNFGLGETVMNLADFSKGVYFIKIFDQEGVFVHKIIKE